MQTPPFKNNPSPQNSPSPVMLVNSSYNRNTSPGLNLNPNPESNLKLNTFASNKDPVITSMQQTPIPSQPNPQGGGERLLSQVILNKNSPEPPLQQQGILTELSRTLKYNPTRKAEVLREMLALQKEGPITEHPVASDLSPERLQKYLFDLKRSLGTSLSEKEISQLLAAAGPQKLKPIFNRGSSRKSNPNETYLHFCKKSPNQPVSPKLKGPTPEKVRRLESMILPEDAQFQGREGSESDGGGGGGIVQPGFRWGTAQTRQLINEYGKYVFISKCILSVWEGLVCRLQASRI